jgi:GMP synthase PP-ATPase subunit
MLFSTNFAVKLIENIRVNVSTVNNTTNTYTPKPPATVEYE